MEFRDCYQEKNIETYQALEKLYSQGKIKAIGVSNFLKHHIEELKNFVSIPIAVNQIEFHPYYYDQETIEYCKQNDIIIEAYSPLGRGEILKDNTIADIAKKYNTKKVVLFGSRARGTNHPKSDIDLAIYGCEDFGDLSDCLNEELWSLLKLDIINMDDKNISPVLVTEIERDGRVLYEKI